MKDFLARRVLQFIRLYLKLYLLQRTGMTVDFISKFHSIRWGTVRVVLFYSALLAANDIVKSSR